MRHHFHAEQWLPYSRERVFTFFCNPDNLPRLMPPWQTARIVKANIQPPQVSTLSSTAKLAGAGTRMTLSFRAIPFSPIRSTWDVEIKEFAWNDHFCDTQLRGPFAFWRHCHRVVDAPCHRPESTTIEGTWLLDELEYELPYGFLGELAHRLVIQRQIQSIFRYRHRQLKELLDGQESADRKLSIT